MTTISISDQRNKRRANCKTCGRHLSAGEGIRYAPPSGFRVEYPKTYCPSCLVAKLAGLQLREETRAALEPVREWCYRHIPYGMESMTFHEIENLVLASGDYMLEAAGALVDTIGDVQLVDYVEAIGYVRRLIQAVVESTPADALPAVELEIELVEGGK